MKSLSSVQLFVTPWTVAYHAPPSMGFSRQEYWSGLPFPSPEDLPDPIWVSHIVGRCSTIRATRKVQTESKKIVNALLSSVQFHHSVISNSLRYHELQCSRPPCPSPTPRVHPTCVHCVGDAIQPSHPLSSPSLPALNLSQHQGLFK